MIAASGMLLAVVASLQVRGRAHGEQRERRLHPLHHLLLILLGIFIGAIVALAGGPLREETAMPQLVAIFNGVGAARPAWVSITEFIHIESTHPATYVTRKCCSVS